RIRRSAPASAPPPHRVPPCPSHRQGTTVSCSRKLPHARLGDQNVERHVMDIAWDEIEFLTRKGITHKQWLSGKPGQRPVVIALAITKPCAELVKGKKWNDHNVGLNHRRALRGRQRAET